MKVDCDCVARTTLHERESTHNPRNLDKADGKADRHGTMAKTSALIG
jgi:hypothetical protein